MSGGGPLRPLCPLRPLRYVLDDTFEPPELAHEATPPPDHAAWVRVVAARRAAHLRAVATRLVARGDLAAPMRFELLAPLFRGEGGIPVQLPADLTGPDGKLAVSVDRALWRSKRLSQHATRHLIGTRGPRPWVEALYEGRFPEAFYILRSWAASEADLRFRLTARSAPVLVAYAGQIECAHGLQAQPPLWLARPTGWLHGEARALVQLAFSRRCAGLKGSVWRGVDHSLDLLAPLASPPAGGADEIASSVGVLRQRLAQVAARRGGIRFTEARLVFSSMDTCCHPDDAWCRVTLETHTPFHRVDAWMNDAFDLASHCWVPIKFWPDASKAVRGHLGRTPVFEPDGHFRNWRRGHRARWQV